jgi:hypothetical protein
MTNFQQEAARSGGYGTVGQQYQLAIAAVL